MSVFSKVARFLRVGNIMVTMCNLLPCYLQHLTIKCEADLGTMVEETKKNSMTSRPHIESSHIERSIVVLYRVSIGMCLDISTKSTARI